MTTLERRYDIDWLRVIAIGLLLIYHIAIVFQPWGVFIGFIQSEQSLESLWTPMSMLNIWRIPLLFFVSGMGVCFAMKKRNIKELLLERSKRILLPFLFGILAIVPIHIIIWQNYYNQDMVYSPNPGHLWFLGNIFMYVLISSPVFFFLREKENGTLVKWIKKLFSSPFGLLVVIIPFVLEAIFINPEIFELYAMTLHGFLMGFLAFFFGFCFVLCGDAFWNTVLRWRWAFLAISLIFYFIRLMFFELSAPKYLMAIESNLWIFAVFGFGFKYLNRPSKALSYLSQGAYPIYIIHMVFIYLGSIIFLPLQINVVGKFVLIILFTVVGCFISYDLIIKRIGLLRPLFGLKSEFKPRTVYKTNPKSLSLILRLTKSK